MANIDAQNKHLVFLEIAKKDLKASKCLYENEFYPQAIFYLQQSIEKAAKSIVWLVLGKEHRGHYTLRLLLNELIIPMAEEARKISEQLIQKAGEFAREWEMLRTYLLKYLKESTELSPTTSSQLLTLINALIPHYFDAKLIGPFKSLREEISPQLTKLEEFKKEIAKESRKGRKSFVLETSSSRELHDRTINLYKDFVNLMDQAINQVKSTDPLVSQLLSLPEIKGMFEHYLECYLGPIYVLYGLSLLSALFSEHYSVVSRYPEDDLNPIEIFNNKSPLVQKLKEYIEIAEDILRRLDFCERSPECANVLKAIYESAQAIKKKKKRA